MSPRGLSEWCQVPLVRAAVQSSMIGEGWPPGATAGSGRSCHSNQRYRKLLYACTVISIKSQNSHNVAEQGCQRSSTTTNGAKKSSKASGASLQRKALKLP